MGQEPGMLKAGSGVADITPENPQYLFGYPHVERMSTGVHDPLLSSALYLSDGATDVLMVANDIIFVPKALAGRARRRIEQATGVAAGHILISATHTHSGPVTVDHISNAADPVVPPADAAYLAFMEDRIVAAAERAVASARAAKIGLAIADGSSVGTNRLDRAGASDPQVPVLAIRQAGGSHILALMLVCSMHPTVLHEDSTLVSADFPGAVRRYLHDTIVGTDCPILHHTGPAGNQSPRHVTRANTFAESDRLGEMLGRAVAEAIDQVTFRSDISLAAVSDGVELPRRTMPPVDVAERSLAEAEERLASLRSGAADTSTTRTAECDWFGAEETLMLARAATEGRLDAACRACMPAEVQVIRIGPWVFAGWQGEMFVEYALAVKSAWPGAFVISLANGELQGYVVTVEAAAEGGYEASNALFAPESGRLLVDKTLELLARL